MQRTKLHDMGHLGAQSFRIGEISVTVLSDGYLPIGVDLLQGITQQQYEERLRAGFVPEPVHHTGVNAFLVETADRLVLIDSGSGQAMGPTLGRFGKTFAELGVSPAEIDTVVTTHLHPDHIGGLGVDNEFAQAELVVHSADVDMWCSVTNRDGAPENFKPFFDLARATVESFGDRVRTVNETFDLGSGLSTLHLPGHTPGHMGVMIESDGDQLLIFSDIVHVPPVQFAQPDVTIGFDADPDQARATRLQVLDMVETDRLWIAGSHITFPGLGHLEKRRDGGYRFIPSLWQYVQ